MTASKDRDLSMTEIDISVPHAARVYDYMLGGVTNFAVDREAAEQAAALVGGMERVRAEVRANRAFLGRAVRCMIREAGIRQFLDIGTGLPNDDNVHAVAQQEAPDVRVVYVDKDPVVLAHAHVLLQGGADGSTVYIQEDFRNPERVLEGAAATLDLGRPVAVMMVGLLHHLRDSDDPADLVARVMAGVPAGSHLAVSHLARDIHAEGYVDAGEHLDDAMEEPLVFRTYDEVAAFFAGLELVDPGVVQVDTWRPADAYAPAIDGWTNPLYVGVGRKPTA
jgi:hypothetical protein